MKTHRNTRSFLTLAFLWFWVVSFGPATASAQSPSGPKDLSDRAGKISMHFGEIETATLPNLLSNEPFAAERGRHMLLQLDGPITPERRSALESAGVSLDQYIPHFTYICRLGDASTAALRAMKFVTWLGHYSNDWKIDREFGTRELSDERKQLAAAGFATARVTFFPGIDRDAAVAELESIQRTVVHDSSDSSTGVTAAVTLPVTALSKLADSEAIQFVEESSDITLRNHFVRSLVQSEIETYTPFYDFNITGGGQVIGTIDNAVDPWHCMFYDVMPIGPNHRKILAYNAPLDAQFHGTHTAGTALGNAQDDRLDTRGVAYDSKLVYGPPPAYTEADVYAKFETHHYQGARIHNNSWGDDSTSAYNSVCRGIDSFCWDYEESMVVWSVSNMQTIRNPENAKNLLAVAASDTYPNEHSHCSGGVGPTDDLRRKPELLAPGCSVSSAEAGTDCGTTMFSGTSVASAAVSGTATLVRQYFVDGFYPSGYAIPDDAMIPSAALIKATLINSGVDMFGVPDFPNQYEGWGRVAAENACYFPGDSRNMIVLDDTWRAEGVVTGDIREYYVDVKNTMEDLRITLAWTDAPASASTGSGIAAVNDLDLAVYAPDGTQYIGNVFANGSSVPGGWWDYDNNVEQVHLVFPSTGIWTIRVNAPAVNWDAQGYALLATGNIVQVGDAIRMCGRGAINAGCGFLENVLTINGTHGGVDRTLHVTPTTPLSFELTEPSSEIGDGINSAACVYMWLTEPLDNVDLVLLPKQLGLMCFGPYFRPTYSPDMIFNSLGYTRKLGQHNAPVPPPFILDTGQLSVFYDLPAGMGLQTSLTVQGILPDWCSQGRVPFSVTNGIVLRVQ